MRDHDVHNPSMTQPQCCWCGRSEPDVTFVAATTARKPLCSECADLCDRWRCPVDPIKLRAGLEVITDSTSFPAFPVPDLRT